MSLDVYIYEIQAGLHCATCTCEGHGRIVRWERSITHNLSPMAFEAGRLYQAIWHPEELFGGGPIQVGQLEHELTCGLYLLQAEPSRFRALAPSNKWGTYDGLVEFVLCYLEAAQQWPNAIVDVSR